MRAKIANLENFKTEEGDEVGTFLDPGASAMMQTDANEVPEDGV